MDSLYTGFQGTYISSLLSPLSLLFFFYNFKHFPGHSLVIIGVLSGFIGWLFYWLLARLLPTLVHHFCYNGAVPYLAKGKSHFFLSFLSLFCNWNSDPSLIISGDWILLSNGNLDLSGPYGPGGGIHLELDPSRAGYLVCYRSLAYQLIFFLNGQVKHLFYSRLGYPPSPGLLVQLGQDIPNHGHYHLSHLTLSRFDGHPLCGACSIGADTISVGLARSLAVPINFVCSGCQMAFGPIEQVVGTDLEAMFCMYACQPYLDTVDSLIFYRVNYRSLIFGVLTPRDVNAIF